MATSYRLLSEQVQRIYVRVLHRDDVSPTLDRREVKYLLSQAINKVLKAQTKEGFTVGSIDIPMCSIATYEGVAVTSSGGISTITLPAPPIHLPMNIGVWMIHDPADPWNPYIPIVGMDAQVMQGSPVEQLEQQVGYEIDGMRARFTKDIRNAPYNITEVVVKLLVQELSKITEDAVLPLSADQEFQVIMEVLEMLGYSKVALQEMNKLEEIEKQTKQ